jgi:signal transduction histidine kinase
LQQLADNFDDMLDRLENAFESQRQFSARVSHELRTPLAIIATSADNVLNREDASESDRQFARTVKDAVTRCDRLIEGLLVIARSEGAAPGARQCDLAEIAGAALESLAPVANANGVEMRELELELAPVTGNPVLLESLVYNLIENAILHNAPPGWVDVGTHSTADSTILSVENSGSPIDQDLIDELFRPFKRGAMADLIRPGGAGLGLAIVRAVARAHSAAIVASPRAGGGLTIEVTFSKRSSNPE